MRRGLRAIAGLWLWLGLITGTVCHADELRPGYLELTQQSAQDWLLVWKAPLRTGITPATQPLLPRGCSAVGAAQRSHDRLAVTTRQQLRCDGPVAGGRIGLSHFGAAQTDVLARIAPLGRPVQTYRLTPAQPLASIAARPGVGQVARSYGWLGVEHILGGADHLLFVVALVLLLTGLWNITKAVTAFTIAHSITLIGTMLGFFGLPQRPVEAVIALSILFLAVEIVKRKPGDLRLSERWPWLVAGSLGLLHGFGFAGALQAIGLPETALPTALLSFNLGVEAGQLAVVGAVLLAMAALRKLRPAWLQPATTLAAYAIGSAAAFWLIERIIA